jgi:hypothetical protein
MISPLATVVVSSAILLGSVVLACYYYLRARADRAERDMALGQAAAATDLASRLQTSLNAIGQFETKAVQNAQKAAASIHAASDAAAFLRDSVRVLPPDPAHSTEGQLPAAPRAHTPGRAIAGFGR